MAAMQQLGSVDTVGTGQASSMELTFSDRLKVILFYIELGG